MLRVCIVLRHRTFPRQRQGWRLRSSHTEQGPTHRGGKSGCKLVTEFGSYSDDGDDLMMDER